MLRVREDASELWADFSNLIEDEQLDKGRVIERLFARDLREPLRVNSLLRDERCCCCLARGFACSGLVFGAGALRCRF